MDHQRIARSASIRTSGNAASLIHRDFQFRNALVADGALSGVLDFDKVEAGDPVRDFAVLALFYPGDEARLRVGYDAHQPTEATATFEEKLIAYRMLAALEHLSTAYRGRHMGRLQEALAVLGRLVG